MTRQYIRSEHYRNPTKKDWKYHRIRRLAYFISFIACRVQNITVAQVFYVQVKMAVTPHIVTKTMSIQCLKGRQMSTLLACVPWRAALHLSTKNSDAY